ncbi:MULTISPECIES: aminomethyl transferase family protein [unclassified Streptomyces]|uniref:Aminomethyl transferase family protein n=1 Tax=Streptomyces sp. NBC_00119 TaxID=2975659 RepID=A0AAU1U551_9ACTN|nr:MULTISPECIES: aminomethyl transferase family protein [unclassified Streptomyces]MCX5435638.1 aminomethyl transferase family protein [Streptomyces sp. NBC_00063]WSE08830.1 aminomethyl transferase family protein [Streptomyces sp. NBC_01445]WSE13434.1 aminomethyl transferase family protein [Streptomyces sp. NBC_01397]WUB97650.1 aminomethyl transferase family protein [Streptomyces sp. NBC_00569]
MPTYLNIFGGLHIWEGDGWKQESMSWKTSSYLASNLTGLPEMIFSGPHAQEFLSRLSINNVYKWPVGTSKHLVMLDERGYIATHGLAVRQGEERFRMFAAMPWPQYIAPSVGLDVDFETRDIFLFQIAGPTSLQVLERLTGESLRDLKFLGVKPITIPGIDGTAEIELSRIGMAGTLAYELRGPVEHGPAAFDATYRAGKEFGLKRLGWRTYLVNHTEGGFPQQGCTFLPAAFADRGFVTHPVFGAGLPPGHVQGPLPGSAEPDDLSTRLRTPFEVNWGWMAKFDHDFIGREALETEAANRRRKTVVLRWNKEDVLDVFASQFESGEEYKHFEFPTTPQAPAGGHADLVTRDGETVGISSVAVYSYYYREMISHSTIDVDLAEIGTEVVVQWGDHGGRIKQIRATVERFPYLELASNKDFDLSSIPSGVAAP